MRRLPIAVVLVWAVCTASALAAFPGANGKIAYVDGGSIWTMNPDGTGKVQITSGVDAAPAWSPDGTRIAFHRKFSPCSGPCSDIWIAHADGSNAALAIAGAQYPSWSPDGNELVFMAGPPASSVDYGHIYKANVDGTGHTLLYDWEDADIYGIGGPAWAPDSTATVAFHEGTLEVVCDPDGEFDPPPECANYYPEYLYTASSEAYSQFPGGPSTPGAAPNWSSDGTKLTFYTPPQGLGSFPREELGGRIGVLNRDGSGRQLLTPGVSGPFVSNGFDMQPAWSPGGTRIVFHRTGNGIHLINPDGTGDTQISTTGTDPDWQALNVNTPSTYVRPKSAAFLRVALVPAFQGCATPNREHGPPLAFGSCSPPQPGSPRLSLGIGDGNPALARSSGFVHLRVMTGAPGPPNDPDVKVRIWLTNVMNSADRSEYTGELRGELTVRRTDREPGFVGATSVDFPVGFTMPCVATPESSTDASNCSTTTTVNALTPGAIRDGYRTVWALDKVRVLDGGSDADADTAADNSLFATQGVFVP